MVDSFIKSRHWANYTLKRAGLPKAFLPQPARHRRMNSAGAQN
jgi:hypothetical protein